MPMSARQLSFAEIVNFVEKWLVLRTIMEIDNFNPSIVTIKINKQALYVKQSKNRIKSIYSLKTFMYLEPRLKFLKLLRQLPYLQGHLLQSRNVSDLNGSDKRNIIFF